MPSIDVPGWVAQPWKANFWVTLFDQLGPEFPQAFGQTERTDFMMKSAACPAFLVAIGVVMAVFVALRSVCCCRPSLAQRPRKGPLVCSGLVTFAIFVLGATVFAQTAGHLGDNFGSHLEKAVGDVQAVLEQANYLNASATELMSVINMSLFTLSACPEAARKTILEQTNTAEERIGGMVNSSAHILTFANDVIPYLQDSRKRTDELAEVASTLLLIPTCMVIMCGVVVVLIVTCSHRGNCSRIGNKCFSLVCVAPAIILVTCFTASYLFGAITLSNFCDNPDRNLLTVVANVTESQGEVWGTIHYYVTGEDPELNPARRALSEWHQQVEEMNGTLDSLALASTVMPDCVHPKAVADIQATMENVTATIDIVNVTSSRENVYPIYQEAIQISVCTTSLIGIGWLVLLQAVVGICCLPHLDFAADSYLARLSRWREYRSNVESQMVYRISSFP